MGMTTNKAFATEFGSNIVTMFTAGAVVGSCIFGPFTGKFGRKPINIACAIFFILGSIVQSCAGMGGSNAHAMMLGGRFINGISVGRWCIGLCVFSTHACSRDSPCLYTTGGSNTVAPYIVAEMAPPSIRGRLVGIYEIGVQLVSPSVQLSYCDVWEACSTVISHLFSNN
jgi:MFS family permease